MEYLIYGLSCSCCCLFWVFVILLIVGMLTLRKRGKKDVGMQDAVREGYEVSRAFVRGQKTREQMLAEDDEEDQGRR